MKPIHIIIVSFFLVSGLTLNAQNNTCELSPDSVKARLYNIVQTLVHDSMGGREAGSEGELRSARYISSLFQEIGLDTLPNLKSYFQEFEFVDGIKLREDNFLKINDKKYKLLSDYYPLNFSANGNIKGEIIRVGYGVKFPSEYYDDYEFYITDAVDKNLKGKIFVIEMGVPPGLKKVKNTEGLADLEAKVKLAKQKGAAAVIFINSDKSIPKPLLNLNRYEIPLDIPVIYCDQEAYKTIMDSNNSMGELAVNIEKNIKKAYNVVGIIDNKAPLTVVIGAHYDHLGYGMTISKHKGGPALHPGADDNASGVSAIIEAARAFKCSGFSAYNIIVIAFSGEEKGLLGSAHFAKGTSYPLKKINFMLNLDMVGRIDSLYGMPTVIGTGSSALWDTILYMPQPLFKIKKAPQATGGSDHASFYQKDIPVLFLFSGLHDDYHKPGDVIEKLGFHGIYKMVLFVNHIVNSASKHGKLTFTKTTTPAAGEGRKSTVTLGVVPDHAYDGVGLRVADVSDGQAAQKGGIIKGDVIVDIMGYEVRDIYSYMNVLAKLKKGDKVTVTVRRGQDTLKLEVTL